LQVLTEVAKSKGLEIVKVFNDEGVSGRKGRDQRKGFDSLLKGATRKEYDTILVWAVDRLGRSLKDLILFLDEIHSIGCNLYIHNQGFDSSTPMGKMMFSFLGIFAQWEAEMLRSRIVMGQQKSKKRIGRPKTVINEEQLVKMREMKEQGIGMNKIAKTFSIGNATLYKLLKVA